MGKNKSFFDFGNSIDTLTIKKCINKKCNDTILIDKPVLMSDKKLINKIYSNSVRVTTFDNVTAILNSDKYPDIFGTNIDTILLCNSIKNNYVKFKNIKNFLELGIGGGFISKYIASKFKINSGVLIDIDSQCINYAVNELEMPKINNEPEKISYIYNPFKCKIIKKNGYTFMQGDGISILNKFFMNSNKLDLLVCNPPYIPSSDSENDLDINAPNFWEGTRLLRYLVLNYNKFADKCIIIVSSLSLVNRYVVSSLKKCKFKILDSHEVPIKVFNERGNILDNPKTLKLLTPINKNITINGHKFKRGTIKSNIENYYPYFHQVNILLLH